MAEDAPERERLLIGQMIGGFRVLRYLGRGGMGEVYLGQEESLGRKVALKFLATRLASDPTVAKRFGREVRAAARLNHPNVVTIYSFHDTEGLVFYAMEYVEGESLAQRIARDAPFDVKQALPLAVQIADALACAHRLGILHRDIKPSNINIATGGLVKVLDFGIAKILGEKTDLTVDGSFLGTLAYASPEQCSGGELDARTDIYSLGVVLYEMLAGRPPHTGDTPLTLLKRIVSEPPPELEKFNPRVPVSVRRLIGRMLEKQRDLRFPDCETVAKEIRQAMSELTDVRPTEVGAAAGSQEGVVAPTSLASHVPKEDTRTPVSQPVEEQPRAAPRKRFRSVRRVLIWVAALLLVAGVLDRLGKNARERQAQTPPVATATPTPQASPSTAESKIPRPTPEFKITPPVDRLTPPPNSVTPPPVAARLTALALARTTLQPVPNDRDLVMVFNIRSLLQSQLIRSKESKVFSREATTNLDAFFGRYRLDWRRDIDRLVVSGITARPDSICIVFQGRLDESYITDQLRRQPGYRSVPYSQRQIHVVPGADSGVQCVTFLTPEMAACGSLSTLQQVWEATGGRASLFSSPKVQSAVAGLDGSPDFWILGVRQEGTTNPVLANLDAWVLQGQLRPDLDLLGIAWPRDTKQIEVTYNLMRLIVEAWRNDKINADLRRLGSNIAVERSVATLSVRVRIPYGDLARLLDNAAARGNYPFR